ncbi:hypothetical protein GYMLUDRAFT_248279 [Collybiopsis luxurians FD-317 M1]|uniref:Uncharacterized protein n=1 Tax=Collybiopsis luxurians FD-317 M1 TaxID=944289 RepID=A0A0D0C0K7_9AGAR|nr:hypothetical protein GYMLUDRAFT_248279 [Collybiopsis luxurians FD-317 M1]
MSLRDFLPLKHFFNRKKHKSMNWLTQLRRFIARTIDPGSDVPAQQANLQSEAAAGQPSNSPTVQYNILPVLDENGIQIAFQRVPRKANAAIIGPVQITTGSVPASINTAAVAASATSETKSKKNWRDLPTFDLSDPARLISFVLLDP